MWFLHNYYYDLLFLRTTSLKIDIFEQRLFIMPRPQASLLVPLPQRAQAGRYVRLARMRCPLNATVIGQRWQHKVAFGLTSPINHDRPAPKADDCRYRKTSNKTGAENRSWYFDKWQSRWFSAEPANLLYTIYIITMIVLYIDLCPICL